MKLKLLLLFCLILAALEASARSLTVDTTQTGTINCNGSSASPTLILTNDPNATRTWLVNYSTQPIYIGFMTTTSTATAAGFSISTSTGNFYLVAQSSVPWSPDGPVDVFTGPMWCVGGGQGSPVTRIRMH